MRSTPELLVDRLELRGRPLEIAELVLAPAPGETTQPVGAHALRTESLPEEVDDRLVERLALAALLAFESFRKARRNVPDRQRLDRISPLQSIHAFIECNSLQHRGERAASPFLALV